MVIMIMIRCEKLSRRKTLIFWNLKHKQSKQEEEMIHENTETAYRFVFGKPIKGRAYEYAKTYYDFKPEEIAAFITLLVEKFDTTKYYFDGRKNVKFTTVSTLVQTGNSSSKLTFFGERFTYPLWRYLNVQTLRQMFAIASYRKIPITIYGKQYTVEYDNGEDVKYFATDEYQVEQSCWWKHLNSGEWRFCKDFLRFKAI